MKRLSFRSGDLELSYLDFGGSGDSLIALHAHWFEGEAYARLAHDLAPKWRVYALDQRGHGDSGSATSYTREDYLGDLDAFYKHLGLSAPAAFLGGSLGGVNTYQFAARYPERVRGIILEDIAVLMEFDPSFSKKWAGVFESQEALEASLGEAIAPYLRPFFREAAGGFKLAFEPEGLIPSFEGVTGFNGWSDWLASSCPALLLGGQESRATDSNLLAEMTERRPHTTLKMIPGGHILHVDNYEGFKGEVTHFLDTL